MRQISESQGGIGFIAWVLTAQFPSRKHFTAAPLIPGALLVSLARKGSVLTPTLACGLVEADVAHSVLYDAPTEMTLAAAASHHTLANATPRRLDGA